MIRFLLLECYSKSIKASIEMCFRVLDLGFLPVDREESGFNAAYRRQ